MGPIFFNVLLIGLIFLTIGLLIWYTYDIYQKHGLLEYHNMSEMACNKDPMEVETVRYQMSTLIIDSNINQIMNILSIIIIGLAFIGLIILFIINATIDKNYYMKQFIIIIVITFFIFVIYKTNNYTNDNVLQKYINTKNIFIDKLKKYFSDNKINSLDDLPEDFIKSFIRRYRAYYDLQNSIGSNGFKVPIYSDYELYKHLQDKFEIIDKDNKKQLNVSELFKYLKLHYDTSRTAYITDIELLIQKKINSNLLKIINSKYINDTNFLLKLEKTITNTYTIDNKIYDIMNYLTPDYKESVTVKKKDLLYYTAAAKGKESNYQYIKTVIDEYNYNNQSNNGSDYLQLSYGKYNPYESLNNLFSKAISIIWIIYIFIAYGIFHLMYEKYQNETGLFITFVSLFFLILLIILMFMPSKYN